MKIRIRYFIKTAGFSLIEFVVVLTVLAVGVGAFITLVNNITAKSADPLIFSQANAIAQSYLEETLLNSFCDPDDFFTDCVANCTAAAISGSTICAVCGGGVEARLNYDDICDYDAINDINGAVDIDGNPISGLEKFNIDVEVIDTGVDLNGLLSADAEVLRVDVTVTHDSFTTLNLEVSGYRANY